MFSVDQILERERRKKERKKWQNKKKDNKRPGWFWQFYKGWSCWAWTFSLAACNVKWEIINSYWWWKEESNKFIQCIS